MGPTAGFRTLVHEMVHSVAARRLHSRATHYQAGTRRRWGDFLDEGVTEAVARSRAGILDWGRRTYDANVEVAFLLSQRIGGGIMEDIVLGRRRWQDLSEVIISAFGGDSQMFRVFLNALRAVPKVAPTNHPQVQLVKSMIRRMRAVPTVVGFHSDIYPRLYRYR